KKKEEEERKQKEEQEKKQEEEKKNSSSNGEKETEKGYINEDAVVKAEGITITPEVLEMNLGETKEYSYSVYPDNAADKTVRFYYNRENFVVYKSGKIKGLKAGTFYLKIETLNGKSATMKIIINVPNKDVEAESITINPSTLELNVGETKEYSYVINPTNTTNKTVKFFFNKEYITVYSGGKIKGLKEGTTSLRIETSNGKSATMKIVIKDPNKVVEAESITIDPTHVVMRVGDLENFSYTIYPETTADKTITYTYDKEYLRVSRKGKFRALKAGTTSLTLTTSNGKSATMNIVISDENEVVEAEKIVVKPSTMNMVVGETKEYTYNIYPENTTDKTVKFYYDKSYITVYKGGKIKGLKAGTTYLTLKTANGKSTKMKIVISDQVIEAEKVVINPTSLEMNVGDTKEYTYTVYPENATNKEVTLHYDKSFISVKDGKIKGLKAGITSLKVETSNGKSAVMKIVIKEKEEIVEAEKIVIKPSTMKMTVGDIKNYSYNIYPENTT
ncbi:MAG: Ig-like domain-containing protein, partial [Bacilli bacterium]|nr:Ig-like domain-containing protein [Bacilli bacterium]